MIEAEMSEKNVKKRGRKGGAGWRDAAALGSIGLSLAKAVPPHPPPIGLRLTACTLHLAVMRLSVNSGGVRQQSKKKKSLRAEQQRRGMLMSQM